MSSQSLSATDRPLRILYFIYTLDGGGAERQLKYLLNAHTDAVQCAVCYNDPAGADHITAPHIEKFHIPRKNKFDLRWGRIRTLIKEWKPDIVFNWIPYILSNTFIPARVEGVPLTLSGIQCAYNISNFARFREIFPTLTVKSISSCVQEDDLFEPYKTIFKQKQGIWIPYGFDVEGMDKVPPTDLSEFGFSDEIPTLLFAARLLPHKNLETLITAVHNLHNNGIDVQLLVCGDGLSRKKHEKSVIDRGLTDKVVFAGYRQDIFGIMKSCTMMVHPSQKEGLPNSVVEGMASNLPLVVSDIPVHSRWIKDEKQGLLYDTMDSDMLTDSIQRMLDDEALRERCARGAREVAESLTIDKMTERYENWYRSLISMNDEL